MGLWGTTMINYDILLDNLVFLQNQFSAAKPFRYLIFEGFLETTVAESILATFPTPEEMKIKNNKGSRKLYLRDLCKLNPAVKGLYHEFASERFLNALAQVAGIPDLRADPHLEGAGLHQGANGSFLNIHADFNVHDTLQMHRRLNLLIYFNKDWEEAYGGYLEIWDKNLKICKMIKPCFNRCVLMETTETTYHGYLKLNVPADVTRKSLAAYLYTPTRPAEEIVPPHSTLWKKRPEKYAVEIIDAVLSPSHIGDAESRFGLSSI